MLPFLVGPVSLQFGGDFVTIHRYAQGKLCAVNCTTAIKRCRIEADAPAKAGW